MLSLPFKISFRSGATNSGCMKTPFLPNKQYAWCLVILSPCRRDSITRDRLTSIVDELRMRSAGDRKSQSRH
jgi:hypothetical protein